jgi:hypothetical protein
MAIMIVENEKCKKDETDALALLRDEKFERSNL